MGYSFDPGARLEYSFDPGALLGTSYVLAGGTRVRLRLLSSSDARDVRELLAARSPESDNLLAGRLLRHDPRRQIVLTARTLVGGKEKVVGVGAIALGRPEAPELIVADEAAARGVGDLLAAALVGRASVLARTRAA